MSQVALKRGIAGFMVFMIVLLAALPNGQTPAAQSTQTPTPEQPCQLSINEALPVPDSALEALNGTYHSEPILSFFNDGGAAETLQTALEDAGSESTPDVWQILTQDITGDAIPEIFLAVTNLSDSDDAGESHLVMFHCVESAYQEMVLYPPFESVSRALGLYDGEGTHILSIADLTANDALEVLFQVDWKDDSGEHAEYYIYEWKDSAFHSLIELHDSSNNLIQSIWGGRNILVKDLNGNGISELILDGTAYGYLNGIYLSAYAPSRPSPTPFVQLQETIEPKTCLSSNAAQTPLPDNFFDDFYKLFDPKNLLTFFNSGGSVETLRSQLASAGDEFGFYLMQVWSQDITGDGIPEIFFAMTIPVGIGGYGDTMLAMFHCVDGVYQDWLLFLRAGAGIRAEGLYSGGGAHVLGITDLNANNAPDLIFEVDWADSYGEYTEYYLLEWKEGGFHTLVEYQTLFDESIQSIGGRRNGDIAFNDLNGDGIMEITVDGITHRWNGELYIADNFPPNPSPTPLIMETSSTAADCLAASTPDVSLSADGMDNPHDVDPMLAYFNAGGTAEGLRTALQGMSNEFGLYLSQVISQDITGDGIPEIFFAVTTPSDFFGRGETTLVIFQCVDGAYQDRLLYQRSGEGQTVNGFYTGSGAHILSVADLNANRKSDVLFAVGFDDYGLGQTYTLYALLEWDGTKLRSLFQPRNSEDTPLIHDGGIDKIAIEDLDDDGVFEIVTTYTTYRWTGAFYTPENAS